MLLRVAGRLRSGRAGDINFRGFVEQVYAKGAVYATKNTAKLVSEDFEEVKIDLRSVEDVEERLISEHAGQSKAFPATKEKELAHQLLHILAKEKEEGETTADFEKRIKEDASKILGLNL
ncbi:TPA: hypothetical protein HA231_00680 [Candidatus Woesearchaeota archaeon]|nr:hypothetical protein [Candidatus Woesearchaeota archaeon]